MSMYQRIMIVVDEGVVAPVATAHGLALAKEHRAKVVFFFALPDPVMPITDMPPLVALAPDEFQREVRRAGDRVLSEAEQQAQAAAVPCSIASGVGTDAAECIAKAATEHQCQLVVIGSHGRNALQRLVFGSVVTRLITLSPVPVLVCKKASGSEDNPQRAKPTQTQDDIGSRTGTPI